MSESSSFEEGDYESSCHDDENILNSTANGNPSIIEEFYELPNATVVNLTASTELHCFLSSTRVVYLHASWRKSGSRDILSNNNTFPLKNASFGDTGYYVCIVQYQMCERYTLSNTSSNGINISDVIGNINVTRDSNLFGSSNVTGGSNVTKDSNVIRNFTRTVYVKVHGPPLLIQPTDRKVFHVAEGQRIQFVIAIASSPSPKQSLTISKSNMEQTHSIDVEFNRTERYTLETVRVPLHMPLYSADVRLTNITPSWTGDYILFINNSLGYVSYNFSIDVIIQEKVSFWESNLTGIVVGSIAGLISLTLTVGIIAMCRTRRKQEVLQEAVKELEEAEMRGSMDSLDIWKRDDRNKEFDNSTQEEDQYRRLQSLNTFNNPEEQI